MAEIKSALELALERTEGVKGDKEKLKAHDAKQKGKKIVSQFLLHPEKDETGIAKKLKEIPQEEMKWVKEGVFQTLISNVSLPNSEEDMGKADVLEKALIEVINNKRQISSMFSQLKQFFQQYLQNVQQLESQLLQQFGQKIKQKEQELSQRMGSEVKLDPASDPEFAVALKQNRSQLDSHFQQAIDDFKEQLKSLFPG